MTEKRRTRSTTPAVCPICGEDVPRAALACAECGADHNSGWKEDADAYDGVDLGDGNFDYDDFVRQEFGSRAKPMGIKTIWWLAGIILLLALLMIYFFGAR